MFIFSNIKNLTSKQELFEEYQWKPDFRERLPNNTIHPRRMEKTHMENRAGISERLTLYWKLISTLL